MITTLTAAVPHTYALVHGGVVVDVLSLTGDVSGMFHADLTAVDVTSASPMPAIGWSFDGTTFAAPVMALALAQQKRQAHLRAACESELLAGFPSAALGIVHTYPSLMTDQANLSMAATASLAQQLPTSWTAPLWCEAGSTWSMAAHTAAQVQQVAADWLTFSGTARQKLAGLAAQVTAAATVDAVKAVTW